LSAAGNKLSTEIAGIGQKLLVVGCVLVADVVAKRKRVCAAPSNFLRTSLTGVGGVPWDVLEVLGVGLGLDGASAIRVEELSISGGNVRFGRSPSTYDLTVV
jgi:hypothetical protein